MGFNLYINFYVDRQTNRQYELQYCLMKNIVCSEVDKVIIVLNKKHILHFFEMMVKNDLIKHYNKVFLIYNEDRPTYNDWFYLTQQYSKEDDISCVSNTDIIFDSENVNKIKNYNWTNSLCMALTRWDLINENDYSTANFFNRCDSQDTWIVKGGFKNVDADFSLGVAGCDNRIAFLLDKHYELINPSKTIKTYHLHKSDIRNYINYGQVQRIPPPYLQIHPTL